VDRADTSYLPLIVASGVLGASPGSRLFLKLREERGYSINATSTVVAYKDAGEWRVTGDVSAGKIADAVPVFLDEIRRMSAEPIPAAELDDVKRSIVARFALTLEQLAQQVTYIGIRRTNGLSADYWDRFPDRILAVTAEDAQRAAARYMDVAKLQIVAVGDAGQLVPILQPLGEVTVVN
jgi:zinc protease